MKNAYAYLGTEAFNANGDWLAEHDTPIITTQLGSSPTLFTNSFTCPANTSCVSVYFTIPEAYSTTNISLELDGASLIDNSITNPVITLSQKSSNDNLKTFNLNVTGASSASTSSLFGNISGTLTSGYALAALMVLALAAGALLRLMGYM